MAQATILLIDDEVSFVKTLSKRLSKRGIDILSAYSGQDALLLLAAGKDVDIVILDVKMPGMGGLETLAAIKKQYPAIEVILLTGHSTIESAVKGMRLGAFDYLTKPCELEALMEKIEDAVKVGSHRR